MARISIKLPAEFIFQTTIPVRITDVNYGGHVGNDSILSLLHEGRMQFLQKYGYSEMNMAGVGLIMSDVAINFRNELFYGDKLHMSIGVSDFTKVMFDIVYKLEKEKDGILIVVAEARTGMVCYDYQRKKVVAVPDQIFQLSSA